MDRSAAGSDETRDSPLTPLTVGIHEFQAVLFSGEVARRCLKGRARGDDWDGSDVGRGTEVFEFEVGEFAAVYVEPGVAPAGVKPECWL